MILKPIAVFMNKFNLSKPILFKLFTISIYMSQILIRLDEINI